MESNFAKIIVVVGKDPNNIPRGLKQLLVASLLNHNRALCGRITREKGIVSAHSTDDVLFINLTIGSPDIEPNWERILAITNNILSPCDIQRVIVNKVDIPSNNSIYRMALFVGATTVGARRTVNSIASSGTEDVDEINEKAKQKTETEKYSSSLCTRSVFSFSTEVDIEEPGESVSEALIPREAKLSTVWNIVKGMFQVDSIVFVKEDCYSWTDSAISYLLSCSSSKGGMGFTDTQIKLTNMDLANILDELLDTDDNCSKHQRIMNAVECFEGKFSEGQRIVRWIVKNLLEKV